MRQELGFIALLGAIWFVTGNTLAAGHWYAVFAALGKLLEDGVRLLVNTVSFARVGAFALAHAGLSNAIIALADSTDSFAGNLLIMLAGNVLIIVLEGLVVFHPDHAPGAVRILRTLFSWYGTPVPPPRVAT